MKKLTRSLVVAGAMVAATSASAFIDGMCPIVGIDYQQVWMEQYKHFAGNDIPNGSSLLPKSYPGASVYLGGRFCDCLGLELGYDWSAKKSKDSTFVPYSAVGAAAPITSKASVLRRGAHLDFVGYMPVADCFELMGTVGIGYVQAKTTLTWSPAYYAGLGTATAKVKGAVGRIRVGGNYMFSDCIGARALLGWESTASLKSSLNVLNNMNVRPFKDSLTASLGLFFKF